MSPSVTKFRVKVWQVAFNNWIGNVCFPPILFTEVAFSGHFLNCVVYLLCKIREIYCILHPSFNITSFIVFKRRGSIAEILMCNVLEVTLVVILVRVFHYIRTTVCGVSHHQLSTLWLTSKKRYHQMACPWTFFISQSVGNQQSFNV